MSDWAVPIVYLTVAAVTALSLWYDYGVDSAEVKLGLACLVLSPPVLFLAYLLFG